MTYNILGAHLFEQKEEWFYKWVNNYDVWNGNSYSPKKGMEMGGSHIFTRDTDVFNLTKTKHNGKSKTRIVNKIFTSNKSDSYIGKRQL